MPIRFWSDGNHDYDRNNGTSGTSGTVQILSLKLWKKACAGRNGMEWIVDFPWFPYGERCPHTPPYLKRIAHSTSASHGDQWSHRSCRWKTPGTSRAGPGTFEHDLAAALVARDASIWGFEWMVQTLGTHWDWGRWSIQPQPTGHGYRCVLEPWCIGKLSLIAGVV